MGISDFTRRNVFWIKDICFNKGRIYKQYNEIKNNINNVDFAEKKLYELKMHAIKNTEFYSKYKVTDEFPIRQKTDYMSVNFMPYLAKSGYDLPIHKSSTSGSTGIPFTVEQNYSNSKSKILINRRRIYITYFS